jgi:hypothetical protein
MIPRARATPRVCKQPSSRQSPEDCISFVSPVFEQRRLNKCALMGISNHRYDGASSCSLLVQSSKNRAFAARVWDRKMIFEKCDYYLRSVLLEMIGFPTPFIDYKAL